MLMPYGDIEGNTITIRFSTADFSMATVVAAIREHLDVLEELCVSFVGAGTEIVEGPTPVFRPTNIETKFEFCGVGDAKSPLERTYLLIWKGVISTFPNEQDWAQAKSEFGNFIMSQADLLRARTENSKS